MKRALLLLSVTDFVFILLLSVAGALTGALSDAVYYLSFVIPVAGVYAVKKLLGSPFMPPRVKISGEGIGLTLAVTAPTLALIFLLSYLTSLALSYFGKGASFDVSGNLVTVILTQAVLTPVLEEALFRYIPLALLSPFSKRGAILYSAAFFALAHCSLYQLPYAFFAGLVFALLDLALDSIIPSVVLHILNNVISVLWLRYSLNAAFAHTYVIVLSALAVASIPLILLLRGRLKKLLTPLFSDGGEAIPSVEALVFCAATLLIAFINF